MSDEETRGPSPSENGIPAHTPDRHVSGNEGRKGICGKSMSEIDKMYLKSIIEEHDRDFNGCLDIAELEHVMLRFGYPKKSDEDLEQLMQKFDTNGDGTLQVEELFSNFDVVKSHSLSAQDLLGAFKSIDKTGDGVIKPWELRALLTAPGEFQHSRDEADAIIKEFLEKYDADGNGEFSYCEFVRMWESDEVVKETISEATSS